MTQSSHSHLHQPREVQTFITPETMPARRGGKLGASAEKLPPNSRFVVYGSRLSGAWGAADAFEEYLAGLGFKDAEVTAVRDVAHIDDSFYGGTRESDDSAHEPPKSIEAAPGRVAKWRRAASLLLRREAVSVSEPPVGGVPQGVVVFPEMRQYTPSGSGMSIPPPREHIQELCDQNGVPVVFIEDIRTSDGLDAALGTFAIEPKRD